MNIVAFRDPRIVDVQGKRGRTWTGKNEDGEVCHVTIFESGGPTVEIKIETLTLPELPTEGT